MTHMSISALALGAAMAFSSVMPVAAMPHATQPAEASSRIQQVQVVIKYGNWRGHRGYRERRAGYRRHSDGFWYPRAAFTVKVAPGVRVKVGARHARWCRTKYRSYRASDNTFIAVGNVRRVCRSPY
jgi:hypothetical protein